MINQLNLSSRPFRNPTLPWLLSALLVGLSLFGFLIVFSEWRAVKTQSEAVDDSIKKVEPQVAELKREGEKIKQSLTPVQQNQLLAAHALVARKKFSWSRLFSDLESVLPGNVIVSNVAVRDVVQAQGKTYAELDFAVFSRSYESVAQMIDRMNNSGMFQAELRGQNLQRDKGNLTEYTMRLRYQPRSGVTLEPTGEAGLTTAQNQTLQEAAR